jgi:hypothetical protein
VKTRLFLLNLIVGAEIFRNMFVYPVSIVSEHLHSQHCRIGIMRSLQGASGVKTRDKVSQDKRMEIRPS